MDKLLAWANRLEQLGVAVRQHLAAIMAQDDAILATVVADEGGDTIFAIDRHVEPVIIRELELWPRDCLPIVLIAEGFGPNGRRIIGGTNEAPRFRLLVDPIDGSRSLMYDKRSAWFLAAVSPDCGETTRLADVFAATMVELPTTKQTWCDTYLAVAGRPAWGRRSNIDASESRSLTVRPSRAHDLRLGFGHVSNFFPGTKILAAELMERIAAQSLDEGLPGQALIFDDQYLSTGGQMAELASGRDRFCCDLRPLFYDILERRSPGATRGLQCHPYDVAGALVAKQAGVVVTDGFGNALDCPFDVQTAVHWCGYANETIAQLVQPIIATWLKEQGAVPPD